MEEKIKTFEEFYPFYLAEHSKMGTRIFHFIGTLTILFTLFYVIKTDKERFLWYIPIFGYGFAWLSHAIFENKIPKTYQYPIWSIGADFKMFYELLTGKQKFRN